MHKVSLLAPAKINLTFDIIGTLEGGYHELESVMQSVDLCDKLTFSVEETDNFQVEIICTNDRKKDFPLDESNLIFRAAKVFQQQFKKNFSIKVEIEKNIPIGAGLAGGSTNAAAVLKALNIIFKEPFTEAEMLSMCRKIGADVAFCFVGGTCLAKHRGDILTPLSALPRLFICLIKPINLSVSTPWAYQSFDNFDKEINKPPLAEALQGIKESNIDQIIHSCGNVFEPVIFSHHPQLQELKNKVVALGAWSCHLTGSGPTLYAAVSDREMAHYLRRKLLKDDDVGYEYGESMPYCEFGPPLEFYITETVNHGVCVIK